MDNLNSNLKNKGISEILIDESSRMNITLYLGEDNLDKENYKKEFDRLLVQPINTLFEKTEKMKVITIKWVGAGVELANH